MPSGRRSCTYIGAPVTLPGMSTRRIGLPMTAKLFGVLQRRLRLRDAVQLLAGDEVLVGDAAAVIGEDGAVFGVQLIGRHIEPCGRELDQQRRAPAPRR